jgi:hypothetical protein
MFGYVCAKRKVFHVSDVYEMHSMRVSSPKIN